MTRGTALERALARAEREHSRAEAAAIEAARQKYIIPFCERRGWSFVAGMGTYGFRTADDEHAAGSAIWDSDIDSLPKRVRAALSTETLTGQDAGSLMRDYTPRRLRK